MGMLIDGKWRDVATQPGDNGPSHKFPHWSSLRTRDCQDPASARYVLVASYSCPWSHATLVARAILGLEQAVPHHVAGGPRLEGYGLMADGPLTKPDAPANSQASYRHLHQLYTATAPNYTGRATVPVLWDRQDRKLVLAGSADILQWLDSIAGPESVRLHPETARDETDRLLLLLGDGLAKPIYSAGLARQQVEYDHAVDMVFTTLEILEDRLTTQRFVLGSQLSVCDLRLFCILLRFDTIYGPFFRCTRKRLTDYTALWAYTRDILAIPGVADTVHMRIIQEGYYLNDGDTNPHGIIAEVPELDWTPDQSRALLGSMPESFPRAAIAWFHRHIIVGSAHV